MPFVTIALARVPQCNSTRYEGRAFADLWLGYQLNCAYDESGGGIWTSVRARVSSAAREIGTERSESEASFITLISVQRLSLHVSDPGVDTDRRYAEVGTHQGIRRDIHTIRSPCWLGNTIEATLWVTCAAL